MCVCEIEQYADDELRACQTAPGAATNMPPGFCYIDPSQASDDSLAAAEAAMLAACPASQKRLLRFLGADTPAQGAISMLACATTAP